MHPHPNTIYHRDFYSLQESIAIFNQLKSEINWKQGKIKIFGKEVLEPRLVAWYGDKPYKYSGKLMQPLEWTSLLLDLKIKTERAAGHIFNSVLLNFYRDGIDSMGWHSDDEPELGQNPIIASVSFGEDRKFRLRLKTDNKIKNEILLENGSLLIMKGDTQHLWQHQIPKIPKSNAERINLTFRNIIS